MLHHFVLLHQYIFCILYTDLHNSFIIKLELSDQIHICKIEEGGKEEVRV